MSTRDHYPAGVPCFVDTLTEDVVAARAFYEGLFGWEFAGPGPMPGDPPGEYWVARLHGAEVAAVGTAPAAGTVPGWNTHVSVDDVDATVRRATGLGARLLVAPVDAPPAGRLAVIADPTGAPMTLWQPAARPGAGRVNEPSAWAMSLLTTPDVDGAERFYGELFGWQADRFGDAIWLWRLPGFVGGEPSQPVPRDVVAAMTAAEDPAAWGVDFWISDADGAARAAPALGGAVLAGPFTDAPFRRAVLAAPDGAAFSVSELRLGG